MSDTKRGNTERLDVAIDRAVREMLDVEPRAGLRGRVLDRISHGPASRHVAVASAFRRKWILGPIAAAAVILLAVTLPWSGPSRRATPPPTAAPAPQAVTTKPTTPSPAPLPTASPSRATDPAVAIARGSRPPGTIHAAVAGVDAIADETAMDGAQVAALDGPPPLVIQQLTAPPSSAMKSIDVAPIQVAALAVNALSDLPRERQHEE